MTTRILCLVALFLAVFITPLEFVTGGDEVRDQQAKIVKGTFVRAGLIDLAPMTITMKPRARYNSPETQIGRAFARAFSKNQLEKAKAYSRLLVPIAKQYEVDWRLVTAVMAAESNFNPQALSPAGAMGLMQVMPDTAAMYKVQKKELYDPETNIRAGVRHLKHLNKLYPENLELVVAAYNAGEGAVAKYNGIPPFKETRGYVKKVLNHYHSAR